MQCDGAPSQLCPVKQWCVCQWAFASYIDRAGGFVPLSLNLLERSINITPTACPSRHCRCDHIQNVVCEATNIQALDAYRQQAAQGSASAQRALACLKQKCKL